MVEEKNKGTVTFDKKDVDKLIISIDNLISGLECTIDDADRLELNIYKNPRTASDYCKSVKNDICLVRDRLKSIKENYVKDV